MLPMRLQFIILMKSIEQNCRIRLKATAYKGLCVTHTKSRTNYRATLTSCLVNIRLFSILNKIKIEAKRRLN